VVLLDTAIDPFRPPRRQLAHPRYDAMEAYFAAVGDPWGPVMMTSTASVQVNLDIGADRTAATRRWRLLHTVGPTMVAAFANSPVHAGADTGWRSARQRVWQHLDPGRTSSPRGADPSTAWADYALGARVMLEQHDDGDWRVDPGPTFRDRLERADPPTTADLACHLTTLFPPVRPRGWFEVRYLDAQPWRWWPVPVAVLGALLDDPEAMATAEDVCRGLDDWRAAAREGLAAPGLRAAAESCFDAAVTGLGRAGEHPALVDLVAAFRDRYPRLGRSPADDPLELP
jgi:glutamate--cysteine ligase